MVSFFFNLDILKCERVKKIILWWLHIVKIILTQMCHILISGEWYQNKNIDNWIKSKNLGET